MVTHSRFASSEKLFGVALPRELVTVVVAISGIVKGGATPKICQAMPLIQCNIRYTSSTGSMFIINLSNQSSQSNGISRIYILKMIDTA